MIMSQEQEKVSRKAYEKPRLRTIPLVAEEVLAINCKTAHGAPGKNGRSMRVRSLFRAGSLWILMAAAFYWIIAFQTEFLR